MMRKGFFLLAVLVAAGAAEASAQEVTARIAGLEGNAEYMEMLREEASLQAREDSVTMVVNRVRRQLRDDPAQRAVYSAEILRCEEQLFSIRTERGRLTDRINTVEQDWVLANLDLSSPSTTTAGRAAGTPLPDSLQTADLVHNAYFREQLPQADYRALLSAQRRERTAFDLAGRDVFEAVQMSVNPKVINTPPVAAVAKDGIQLIAKARVTVRANIKQLVGGAGEETVLARVGEGIVSSIGSAVSHKVVLENPDSISRVVLDKGLDAGTAFEILSIDIADIDVGKNIGAQLQMDQAQADKNIAQAKAEERRAMAVALEQENRAKAQDARAKVILAEAEVPLAMAEAFRNGNLGIMDYYKMKNVMADTAMREAISKPVDKK